MRTSLCILLASIASLAWGRIMFRPQGFLKLPGRDGGYALNKDVATKAAYDSVSNLLYVIGERADVLNVVDMRNSLTNPTYSRQLSFNRVQDGLPVDIKVCRGTIGREYLAISFRSLGRRERGHVHFYGLLNDPMDAFLRIKTIISVEGYDPNSIGWNRACTELVVASKGDIHLLNNQFEDPRPQIDILVPSFGLNVDRRNMPFSESAIASAGIRQVFTKCDSGTNTVTSSHVQDLEPVKVVVDDDNIAYTLFQSNNGIGRMDLNNPLDPMTYFSLGMKDWTNLRIDTSSNDGGINLNRQTMQSLYQPSDAVTFTFANKTWLATADTGDIKQYNVRSGSTTLCTFDESAQGTQWKEGFTQFFGPLADQLQANLSAVESLGNMRFSRLKTRQDGYNALQQGYDHLLTYGGRGWSLMDTTTMQRVYDSGDILETYYESADVTDSQKAVFNSFYNAPTETQSQNLDRTSVNFGPNPTAIATGNIAGTQVITVANGNVGGLYIFTVTANSTGGPYVNFEGFGRRGSPGLTWDEAYKQNNTDTVGEPEITDLLWIEDEGQHVVAAISSVAGVVSMYSVEELP